jgi:hypothetical protein
MLIPYTILEECLVLGSNLVCSGAARSVKNEQKLEGLVSQESVCVQVSSHLNRFL